MIIVIVALGAAGYAYYLWQGQRQASASANFQTTVAQRGSLTASIGATGLVRSRQSVILTWKSSGTVEAVNFAVGDQAPAGERLAELSQTSLPQNVILARRPGKRPANIGRFVHQRRKRQSPGAAIHLDLRQQREERAIPA
ncbi:MAG: hypothetical protein M5U05_09030 [Anaerolineales bacterium]|nr:hypothetical protein [Anaerolineales bacterium]